jgi:BMFP domain-containing protein YqiC
LSRSVHPFGGSSRPLAAAIFLRSLPMFFDAKSIDEIASKLANTIPPGLNHLKEDLEKNFHAVLQGALSKLDLVTREEFEVQKLVLAKTRANLEALEKRVAALEQQVLSKEEL